MPFGPAATPLTGRAIPVRGDFTFSNNVIVGSGYGQGMFRFGVITGSEFDGLKIYSNTLVGDSDGEGIAFLSASRAVPYPYIRNIDIKNNIIYSPGTRTYVVGSDPYGSFSVGFQSNYNHYYWGASAKPFEWSESTVRYLKLADWQALGNDTFTHSQNTDPMFVNINNPLGPDGIPFTADDGLRPAPGSPVIAAGVNGVNIGAYQSCSSSCDAEAIIPPSIPTATQTASVSTSPTSTALPNSTPTVTPVTTPTPTTSISPVVTPVLPAPVKPRVSAVPIPPVTAGQSGNGVSRSVSSRAAANGQAQSSGASPVSPRSNVVEQTTQSNSTDDTLIPRVSQSLTIWQWLWQLIVSTAVRIANGAMKLVGR